MNIKKYINVSLIILLVSLLYSCSGDNAIDNIDDNKDINKEETSLSIQIGYPEEAETKHNTRTAINPNSGAESEIYSLEVLIFRSQTEARPGELDGYAYIRRTTQGVIGEYYDKEFKALTEIKGITLTAGKRDIYIIANPPNPAGYNPENPTASPNVGYFKSKNITTLSGLKAEFESLSTQGMFPHPGTTRPDPNDEDPIGGIRPSDWKTNLTMVGIKENIQFDNLHSQHYLGYTSNGGLPIGITTGKVLDGTNPFYVERLAARVAFKKIKFNLTGPITFETGFPAVSDYTYQLDSVFLMNVKTGSNYIAQTTQWNQKFGYGCQPGYTYLATRLANLAPVAKREHLTYLTEPIFSREYDIDQTTTYSTPLWFYAYENNAAEYPTYMVIGVRFNFTSTKDAGQTKTVKCYYPIIVNKPGTSADHTYIKRNNQYYISATITGLGTNKYYTIDKLRSGMAENDGIEVEQVVGENLFPWVGNTYK